MYISWETIGGIVCIIGAVIAFVAFALGGYFGMVKNANNEEEEKKNRTRGNAYLSISLMGFSLILLVWGIAQAYEIFH